MNARLRGQTSYTPLSDTGTIGTPMCRARIGEPFLNFFTVPSIERSPSGKRIRTRPCFNPKPPAFIAGTRFESASTGTQLTVRATHFVNGVSKYSTAPTKNMLRNARYGRTPHTKIGSR